MLSKILVKSENLTAQNNDLIGMNYCFVDFREKIWEKVNLFKLNVTRSNQYVAGNLNVTVDNFQWACLIIHVDHYKTDNNRQEGEFLKDINV